MAKTDIVTKALKCIDEIYPDANTLNDSYFPTESFVDEAVRWVIDVVPTHELTIRKVHLPDPSNTLYAPAYENGVGTYMLTDDLGRLVYFKAPDWKRPVFEAITENDPRYIQQRNMVLRGNPSRPVVAIVQVGPFRFLEWYTTRGEGFASYFVPYAPESIPMRLEDLCAWKLAEIVLLSMSDAQHASACTVRVNELLQQLSL